MNPNKPTACPYSTQTSRKDLPAITVEKRWSADELCKQLQPSLSSATAIDLQTDAQGAWRNSVRCSGRARWRSLRVIDARTANSVEECFDALFEHLKRADANRSAESFITVFPKFDPAQAETRIWNHQLIRYAGYQTNDGSVLGDPMNIHLTQIAIDLGWQPPHQRSRFDILPIILQFSGKLQLRPIPKEYLAEVTIRHPEHPAIESLGLRWYAVPVVSDMLFASEQAIYPAAPFSGHYVSTEIAARNLADLKRYNQLPQVAAAIGLDPSKHTKFWIDRALVALNEAVLWSFEHAGYRIVDHHTVTSEFSNFCKKEDRNQRTVHGDWPWLIPPMSGASTPIFFRSFEPKIELPNFLYQELPWNTPSGQAALAAST
ncbi:MAG: nitric oxide synthase [Opitutae bacterium]|jgi:nitric-oxide synthase|nr:nitric oxide synthase [Opitutae bacterium]